MLLLVGMERRSYGGCGMVVGGMGMVWDMIGDTGSRLTPRAAPLVKVSWQSIENGP